jgi:hypothetical protein
MLNQDIKFPLLEVAEDSLDSLMKLTVVMVLTLLLGHLNWEKPRTLFRHIPLAEQM